MSKQELLLTYWSGLADEAQDQLLAMAKSMVTPANLPELSAEEARLVTIINRRFAAHEQQRFNELRDRHEGGMLAESEHQELLTWIDQIEASDAERAEAMIKLARLRGVDLDIVVAEFLPVHVGV
jgi:hypothetical protein